MTETPPPAPEDAHSWPEFTARLRSLYEWCGSPKYRALCGRNRGLSPAAVSNLIGRNPLTRPPETATARFADACLRFGGCPDVDGELARWTARWHHLSRPARPEATGEMPDAAVGERAGTGPEDRGGGVAMAGTAGRPFGRGARPYAVAGLVAAATAALTAAAVLLVAAPPEPAAGSKSGCRHLRGPVEDGRTGRTWSELFQCPNVPGSDVFQQAREGTRVGVLQTDPSWFVCWARGERHRGGNDVWYYTRGDLKLERPELEGWGYVPASALDAPRHPAPAITERCPF